jgi:hypothetical protein
MKWADTSDRIKWIKTFQGGKSSPRYRPARFDSAQRPATDPALGTKCRFPFCVEVTADENPGRLLLFPHYLIVMNTEIATVISRFPWVVNRVMRYQSAIQLGSPG